MSCCSRFHREEGDAWVRELEDDVRAECEEKYGHVVHIALDPNTQGDIYLKFDRVQGGENAIKGLNGRFFGGRQISAQPVVDAVYSSLFARTTKAFGSSDTVVDTSMRKDVGAGIR